VYVHSSLTIFPYTLLSNIDRTKFRINPDLLMFKNTKGKLSSLAIFPYMLLSNMDDPKNEKLIKMCFQLPFFKMI
jgi:hypothetical protein